MGETHAASRETGQRRRRAAMKGAATAPVGRHFTPQVLLLAPPPFPSASGLLRAPGQSQCRAHVNHSPLANERPPFPRGDVRDASSASALSLLAVKTAPPAGGGGGSVLSCSGHVTRSSPGGEVTGADVQHIVPFVLCSVVAW